MTTGYDPNWDIDLRFGKEGEQFVLDLLSIDAETVEIKRKRYLDFRFYVETHQLPDRATEYQPSGIQTTKADYWAYVIGETGVVVFVPTEHLKRAARNAPKKRGGERGDNPTRGRLVGECHLFDNNTGEA